MNTSIIITQEILSRVVHGESMNCGVETKPARAQYKKKGEARRLLPKPSKHDFNKISVGIAPAYFVPVNASVNTSQPNPPQVPLEP